MTDFAPMIDTPDEATPRTAPADLGRFTAPGGSPVLFPSCDPRGVLGRALAPDAPPWQTRPDALLFGWMLGLAPGVAAAAAARSVLAVARSATTPGAVGSFPSPHQQSLLDGLDDIANGPPNIDPRRR